ncbi:uncharacterized protein LOC121975706 isoform X2 [Zingiber officinale]|uniref:uncharacterized protein LOC121975706 isoform X2 n=1 Tax=Zingiber officinale TaxID=94328 RepID=UPI001C4B5D22|nr:uncharacterized protein LOC121975706 isoform X2 [Zingiber officinale]
MHGSKQAVRITKVRIEQIKKKKKQAVVCIDKKDVAGLVAGCWQANVFERMDALIHEMNLVSCLRRNDQNVLRLHCGSASNPAKNKRLP